MYEIVSRPLLITAESTLSKNTQKNQRTSYNLELESRLFFVTAVKWVLGLLSLGCSLNQPTVESNYKGLCIKVGRGQGDRDTGTRVWGLGTWGRETRDLRTSSMGRGDVKNRDAGDAGCE